MTAKPSLTERKLITMLGENTGRHMLDSGGAYGRNWERNQGRAWLAEPAISLEFDERDGKLEISATRNVFHFLRERVTYRPDLQSQLTRFAKRPENEDSYWLEIMESFAKKMGCRNPVTVNTYNGEDMLSQVLQYTAFDNDDGAFALIQIHGGCDVRGGYTGAAVFEIDDGDMWGLTDNARMSLHAKDFGMWDSDNAGYSFESQEIYTGKGLFGDTYRKAPELDAIPVTRDSAYFGDGIHIVVADKNVAYAPNGSEFTAY
jgi:hypothetical protein